MLNNRSFGTAPSSDLPLPESQAARLQYRRVCTRDDVEVTLPLETVFSETCRDQDGRAAGQQSCRRVRVCAPKIWGWRRWISSSPI